MPELPEVETLRRSLLEIIDSTVIKADIRTPSLLKYPSPEEFVHRVEGKKILSLERRGKYIFARLEDEAIMIIHLGMTGKVLYSRLAIPVEKHTHWSLELSKGYVAYIDPRRFGRLLLGSEEELRRKGNYPILGAEPFDLTLEKLSSLLVKSSVSLKAFLLDQRKIAGLGNIYADEACFKAMLDPRKKAGTLSIKESQRLLDSIVSVLNEGIAKRGSSVRDYRDGRNQKGSMQESLMVYGRVGELCLVCSTPLCDLRLAGRQTVFCPLCQG